MTSTAAHVHAHSHSSTYVSDNMRNLLKVLLTKSGLDPQRLLESWNAWIDRAVRTWLESEHLLTIIVEFHQPGSGKADDRWDFPISYAPDGIEEMWTDRQFFSETLPKAPRPSATALYRVVLEVKPGHPEVEGVTAVELLDISGKTARSAGTVVATPHMTAGARYYR